MQDILHGIRCAVLTRGNYRFIRVKDECLFAGGVLGVASIKILDAAARLTAIDPLVGLVGDRVRTRWGRRKPALLISIPLVMYGVYRIFFPGAVVSEIDLLVSLLVLYLGWTLVTLSHIAWASELSDNYDERSRIMSYVQFFTLLGTVGVMVTSALIEYLDPNANMSARAEAIGWLVLTTLPVLVIVAVFSISEPKVSATSSQSLSIDFFRSVIANRPFRRLLLADLLLGLQGGINGTVHFFFVIHVLLLPQSASIFLVAIFLTGLLLVPLFLRISYRFGKHRTLCFGAIQSSVATACFFVIPQASFWLALVTFIMVGVNFGAKDFLMR